VAWGMTDGSSASTKRQREAGGWTEAEQGHLTHLSTSLVRLGVDFDFTEGVTDEGEPWATWSGAATGSTLLHLHRLEQEGYRLLTLGQARPRTELDLDALISAFLARIREADPRDL
jgi:hypothetical protein